MKVKWGDDEKTREKVFTANDVDLVRIIIYMMFIRIDAISIETHVIA